MATDNFYFVEGNSNVKDLVKTLVTEITQNSGIYKWDLVYPDSIDKIGSTGEGSTLNLITDNSKTDKVETVFRIGSQNDKCIIKATTTYGKEFYLK